MNLKINPYATVVKEFEQAVADYAGSRYAIAVDTCTDAIFLCLKMLGAEHVSIPKKTYCSVPNAIIHAGAKITFTDEEWQGEYEIKPWGIIDSALRFRKKMYKKGTYRCQSFQYRKHIPIGRGGVILTDSLASAEWLRLARFNGRPERPLDDDEAQPKFIGWLCHMEPERAARGLNFMMHAKDEYPDLIVEYPDLSRMSVYQPHTI